MLLTTGALLGSAAISSLGSITSSLLGSHSAKSSGKANRAFARAMFAAQMELANTAHQREVRDLRAAGLNPILSAQGSGASVPSAIGATESPYTNFNLGQDSISDAVKDIAFSKSQQAKDLRDAQIDNVEANTASMIQNSNSQEISALANSANAETNQWQLFNAQEMDDNGLNFFVRLGDSYRKVTSVRINKVTGEAYDVLTGKPCVGDTWHREVRIKGVPSNAKSFSNTYRVKDTVKRIYNRLNPPLSDDDKVKIRKTMDKYQGGYKTTWF